MVRSKRYSVVRRPIGWRNESYRHYLAGKGITTNRYSVDKGRHQYFVRDFLKGNRNAPDDPYASVRKSLNAQGYSSSEQQRIFGIPARPKKSKTLVPVPDRDELVTGGFEPAVGTIPRSAVASIPRAEIETEGSFSTEGQLQASQLPVVEEQPTTDETQPQPMAPQEKPKPLEDKTVAELTAKEKRQLMDQLQTKGIPEPPPSFSTPGAAEMPPSTPFSQEPLVETPAQRPFTEERTGTTTVRRPLQPKKRAEPGAMDFINEMGTDAFAYAARKDRNIENLK